MPVVSEGCDARAALVRTIGAWIVVSTCGLRKFVAELEAIHKTPEQLLEISRRLWAAIADGGRTTRLHNAAAMGGAYFEDVSTKCRSTESAHRHHFYKNPAKMIDHIDGKLPLE